MKRRLFKLVLFLLLGAIVNVAVAWGCALWIKMDVFLKMRMGEDIRGASQIEGTMDYWTVISVTQPGATLIVAERISSEFWARFMESGASHGETLASKYSKLSVEEALPMWSQLHAPIPDNKGDKSWQNSPKEHAWGWPCIALSFKKESRPLPVNFNLGSRYERRVVQGWILSEKWPGLVDRKVLPLRPIWLGIIFNTIFYSTILWLLTLAPFTARRMIRSKRGLCIKCGYDLRGAEHIACPECGKELIAKVKP